MPDDNVASIRRRLRLVTWMIAVQIVMIDGAQF
jgi:hypothetical protein